MDQATDMVKKITDWAGTLWALPVRVVIPLLVIVFAQLLKKSPKVPNWFIPWSCCATGGLLSWWVLSEVPNAASTPKTNVLIGILSGFIAHLIHYRILANPDNKIPWAGGLLCGGGDTEFTEKKNILLKPNDGLPPEGPKLP